MPSGNEKELGRLQKYRQKRNRPIITFSLLTRDPTKPPLAANNGFHYRLAVSGVSVDFPDSAGDAPGAARRLASVGVKACTGFSFRFMSKSRDRHTSKRRIDDWRAQRTSGIRATQPARHTHTINPKGLIADNTPKRKSVTLYTFFVY